MEKLKISIPILVEGKYDKIKLESIIDGNIFTTNGFQIFNKSEKACLLKKLADQNGIIILTDSDGGGTIIRSHLTGYIDKEKIYQLYIPQIKGKEKRKEKPSKEGYLGVEGIDSKTLYDLFDQFIKNNNIKESDVTPKEKMTKTDLFEYKLTGYPNSAKLRNELAIKLDLPQDMTPNAFLQAINMLYSKIDLLNTLKDIET